MSQRKIARLARVNVKIVAARLVWQANLSREKNQHFVKQYIAHYGPITTVQFDDLVTFEHTKYKPLSVPVAVVAGTRVPIAFGVASIPAFGHLAKKPVNATENGQTTVAQCVRVCSKSWSHCCHPMCTLKPMGTSTMRS